VLRLLTSGGASKGSAPRLKSLDGMTNITVQSSPSYCRSELNRISKVRDRDLALEYLV